MKYLIIVLSLFIGVQVYCQDDPCDCKPERGKKPYRLEAKIETKYENFHSKKKTITPETMRAWEDTYAERTKRDVDKNAARLKRTPEDSVYTLEGWVFEIKKEIDCDYHIVIGGQNATDQKTEVEVTVENCALQKKIMSYMKQHDVKFDKEIDPPIKLRVKGLGFYDGQHGKKKLTGTAWELHPVKSLKFE
jgi:hypothetical protein